MLQHLLHCPKSHFLLKELISFSVCFQVLCLVTSGFHPAISNFQLLSHNISNSKKAKMRSLAAWKHTLSAVPQKWHCFWALINTILWDNTGAIDLWGRVVIAKKVGAELNPQNSYGPVLNTKFWRVWWPSFDQTAPSWIWHYSPGVLAVCHSVRRLLYGSKFGHITSI